MLKAKHKTPFDALIYGYNQTSQLILEGAPKTAIVEGMANRCIDMAGDDSDLAEEMATAVVEMCNVIDSVTSVGGTFSIGGMCNRASDDVSMHLAELKGMALSPRGIKYRRSGDEVEFYRPVQIMEA